MYISVQYIFFFPSAVIEKYLKEWNNCITIYVFFTFQWISLIFVHCSYKGVLVFFENGLWISSILWMKHIKQTFHAIKLSMFHCWLNHSSETFQTYQISHLYCIKILYLKNFTISCRCIKHENLGENVSSLVMISEKSCEA